MKVGDQAILSGSAGPKRTLLSWSQNDWITWFKKFEIMSWWDRKVEELSKGMQQKVQFIVTIIHEPRTADLRQALQRIRSGQHRTTEKRILELKDKGSHHHLLHPQHGIGWKICNNIALINTSLHTWCLAGAVPGSTQPLQSDRYTVKIHADNQTQLDLQSLLKIEIHTDRLTADLPN